MILQIEQRFAALNRDIEIGDLVAQLAILAGNATALADQPARRQQGRAHRAEEHGKLNDFKRAECNPEWGVDLAKRIIGMSSGRHGAKDRSSRASSRQHSPQFLQHPLSACCLFPANIPITNLHINRRRPILTDISCSNPSD